MVRKQFLNDGTRLEAILASLADDYDFVCYVDVINNEIRIFQVSGIFAKYIDSTQEYIGNHEFDRVMRTLIVQEDFAGFLKATDREACMEKLKKEKVTYSFRIQHKEREYYYRINIAMDQHNPNGVVIGFANVDYITRTKMARAESEKQYTAVLKVLVSEYSSVYYVNIDSDEVIPFSMSERIEGMFGDTFKKVPYSVAYNTYVDSAVIETEKDTMRRALSPDYVRRELIGRQAFTKIYLNNNKEYCEMKCVRVNNEAADDNEDLIVVMGFGVKDNDIRRDMARQIELVEAKRRAEAASDAKSAFLFNMSHDIRTPMNAIIGFTQMAAKYAEDPEHVRSCLEKVEASSNHLLKLINDVLDMSRIESGSVTVNKTPNSLSKLANEVYIMTRDNASEKDVELKLVTDLKNEFAMVDALHLKQVVINVISNAIKYTKAGGTVTLSVFERTSYKTGYSTYVFEVADTGVGMSRSFLPHLFDSFSRERTVTESGIQGTGLGMAIVKTLVELMGGHVDVDSQIDVGTTVTIQLELQICDAPQETEETNDNVGEIDICGMKVLLVEDNALNREIAKDILEDAGVIVSEAEDGAVALDMIRDAKPDDYDVILMDIQMPYMDGYAATRSIRAMKDDIKANIPIIAMTANAFEEDRAKALSVGMNEHLAKPVDIKKFVAVLKSFKRSGSWRVEQPKQKK